MFTQKNICYQYNNNTFEGVLISPQQAHQPLPGLLMAPNWLGITEEAIALAKKQAAHGYHVFIADLYGQEIRPKNNQEAGEAMLPLKDNRAELRNRMQKALAVLLAQPSVDQQKIACFGFCFGGCCALELARSGSDIKAAISFHGNLDTPNITDAKQIKGSVLVLHGANDPFVPESQVDAFLKEMKSVNQLDWQFVSYGGAVHGFTDVNANEPASKQYNAKVTMRAFNAMNNLLNELFN